MRNRKTESEGKDEVKSTGRKVYSGVQNDKLRTKQRLVAAVGKVIQKKGYGELSATNIARECGVDKKLVWTYFGGVDKLISEYIEHKDFWKNTASKVIDNILKHPEEIGKNEIATLLQSQFDTVLKDRILQKILHWELGEKNKLLRAIADQREELGESLFDIILPDFSGSGVNLRARLAIIIGGIYYLAIHAKSNGSNFCGIDLNLEEGKDEILEAISELVFEAYEKAGVNK